MSGGQIVLLGLISTIGPLSTDMYLPAFPDIERDLGQGAGSAQFTLACWLIGLAFGQFCLGPLSDRFGRRWPLLLGLGVYMAASIGLATTTSYTLFCILRFVAALGGSISSVVPRAIVRDVATGREAVRITSQLTLVFGVGPILAPTLGSALLAVGSWRLIFWAATFGAFLLIVACALTLGDTLPPQYRRRLPPVEILSRYVTLARDRSFFAATLISSFSTFVMFAYIANAPALFEHLLAFTPRDFAIFFGLNAAGFILATQINGRVSHHFSYIGVMECGIAAALLCALILLAICATGLTGPADPWPLCAMVIATTFTLGFIGPNANVLALAGHGHQAGSASALLGTLAFGIGGSAGILMSLLPADWLGSTPVGMLAGIAGMIVFDIWRRGKQAPHDAAS